MPCIEEITEELAVLSEGTGGLWVGEAGLCRDAARQGESMKGQCKWSWKNEEKDDH
jgi:hypothetical protein